MYFICKHFLNVREMVSSVALGFIAAMFTLHSTAIIVTSPPQCTQLRDGRWGLHSEGVKKIPLLQGEQILPRGGKRDKGNE